MELECSVHRFETTCHRSGHGPGRRIRGRCRPPAKYSTSGRLSAHPRRFGGLAGETWSQEMMSEADLVATIKQCGGKIVIFQPAMRIVWEPSSDGAEVIFAKNCGWHVVRSGSADRCEIDLLAPRQRQNLEIPTS